MPKQLCQCAGKRRTKPPSILHLLLAWRQMVEWVLNVMANRSAAHDWQNVGFLFFPAHQRSSVRGLRIYLEPQQVPSKCHFGSSFRLFSAVLSIPAPHWANLMYIFKTLPELDGWTSIAVTIDTRTTQIMNTKRVGLSCFSKIITVCVNPPKGSHAHRRSASFWLRKRQRGLDLPLIFEHAAWKTLQIRDSPQMKNSTLYAWHHLYTWPYRWWKWKRTKWRWGGDTINIC